MSVCIKQTAASRPDSFSLLLSYFVAQYVLIIVVQFFCKNLFQFSRNNFFRSTLKYANFHRGYYPSCVTSYNECTRPKVILLTQPFVLSSKLNPLLFSKLAKKYLFFGEYFCPTHFSYVEKQHQNKEVLTMTDTTQSTELQAFIRKKDGFIVTVKISLCICVVLS